MMTGSRTLARGTDVQVGVGVGKGVGVRVRVGVNVGRIGRKGVRVGVAVGVLNNEQGDMSWSPGV